MTDARSPAPDQEQTAPPATAYIAVTGADAASFLDGLLTINVSDMPNAPALSPVHASTGPSTDPRSHVPAPAERNQNQNPSDMPAAPALSAPTPATQDIRHGALLSPQGKIQHALVIRALPADHDPSGGGFVLKTCGGALADRLVKRLTLMKLRADVTIAAATDTQRNLAGSTHPYHKASPANRIRAGVALQGVDFGFEEVFPTDVNLDLLGGVDYQKGCFVGQEVVSRMARRGTIRKRTLIVEANAAAAGLSQGADITTQDGDRLGTITSSATDDHGGVALAVIRTDRLLEAGGLDATVMVGDTPCTIALPPYTDAAALGLTPAEGET